MILKPSLNKFYSETKKTKMSWSEINIILYDHESGLNIKQLG